MGRMEADFCALKRAPSFKWPNRVACSGGGKGPSWGRSMFGLHADAIVERVAASGRPPHLPGLGESVLRGAVGFTLVSVGGFAPWMLAGGWFYRHTGEPGLYAACALVFIGLSGPLLHPLIIGPGSLVRFYQLFGLAFLAYSTAWSVAWMALRGGAGGLVGLAAGAAVMGGIFARGFRARGAVFQISIVLFLVNAAGYFAGEWAHDLVRALRQGNASGIVLPDSTRAWLSKAAWGVCYGLGFGAGIGYAFHACQAEVRRRLRGTPQ